MAFRGVPTIGMLAPQALISIVMMAAQQDIAQWSCFGA